MEGLPLNMIHMPNLLQNIANTIVFIMLVNRIYISIIRWSAVRQYFVIGILFGAAGLISMNMPIHVGDGIIVDLKAVLAGMSGLLGGPVSAALTFLLVGSYRVYLGGIGMVPGLVCIAAAALAGSFLHVFINKKPVNLRRMWWVPILLGLFIVLVQMSTTLMFPSHIRNDLIREFTVPLLIVYPLSAVVFHYFITVEWVRYRDTLIDRITQLPRYERMQGKWERMIKQRQPFALVILNVERLRTVNDMYGIQAGNDLLRECGGRLTDHLPTGGLVCRLDGHDFAVSLPFFDTVQASIWITETKEKLSAPYWLEGSPCSVTFGTGLALYEGGDASLEDLFLQAETALRHAMDSGMNQTVSYESRLTEQIRYRTRLEKDLGFALERGQFHLSYQPQFELETGKLRGFEALLRWSHPDWGPISPAEFIPLAEQTRLIIPIGDWVLKTACDMAMKLNLNGTGVTMAVNVSAVQLLEPDFPNQVSVTLLNSGLNGDLLELELTESTMVQSFEKAADQLQRLKECGVRLALDDFGVGYSSLSYLRRLPFDLIKIDRSFIEDIGRSHDDRMTKSIIDWVRELRYGIVAEGLESYDQLYWLKQWKCDIAQGFLFSKPMPEDDLLQYLRQLMPFPLPGHGSDTGGMPSTL
ncbi:EAL domain-containing protein [Cohnella sp. CFH 77786]|uniref:EAL domain-containing protein n=1 Tax=Cohnella sp. CFH 77786 TaxID=2662265 RepID=UPI001C60D6C7|nr:EAL domain-containing protein [Cohnella sp. CFH 77786]MBW5448084.1 EAL domain-containing protein [Cohnella sp. CFH 77786]